MKPSIKEGITFVSLTTKRSPSDRYFVILLKILSSNSPNELTLKSFEESLGFNGFSAIRSSGNSKSKSENEKDEAKKIDQILQPLHKSLFIESNPAPVKYAAKLLGLCSDEIRLPLVKIKKETEEKVKKNLLSAKLIS